MKRSLVLVPLVLLLATPASAGRHTDPCGDTAPVLQAGPVVQDAPGERARGFDIASLHVRDLVVGGAPSGLAVTLELCGDVPAAELPSSAWQVGWALPGLPEGGDRCSGGLVLNDRIRPSDGVVVRTASLDKSCSRAGQTPVLNGASSTTYQLYSVDLPAGSWRVSGNTIEWSLHRDASLGRAAEQLQAGTALTGPTARTRDGRMVTQFAQEGLRLTGPGTEDSLPAGPDHSVG